MNRPAQLPLLLAAVAFSPAATASRDAVAARADPKRVGGDVRVPMRFTSHCG